MNGLYLDFGFPESKVKRIPLPGTGLPAKVRPAPIVASNVKPKATPRPASPAVDVSVLLARQLARTAKVQRDAKKHAERAGVPIAEYVLGKNLEMAGEAIAKLKQQGIATDDPRYVSAIEAESEARDAWQKLKGFDQL